MASPLNDAQRAAFEAYFKKGGGFVGVGSAIETDPSWSFLTDALGTRAAGRTAVQTGTVKVFDRVHDATKNLPEYWDRTDAFYNFTTNVRGLSHVLATVVEDPFGPQPGGNTLDGIAGGTMGANHPISFCKDYLGGRSFYTGLGNTPASFDADLDDAPEGRDRVGRGPVEPDLQRLRRDGARELPGDQGLRPAEPGRADQLRPVPRRSHHPDRAPGHRAPARPGQGHDDGPRRLRVGQPAADACGSTPTRRTASTAARSTTTSRTNHWVYLYYSPQTVTNVKLSTGRGGHADHAEHQPAQRGGVADGVGPLHRATSSSPASSSSRTRQARRALDLNSEQQILRVTNNRQECCHVAGDMDFDKHNNLWITTGDDTPAAGIDANGYGPFEDQLLDEQQTVRATNATGGTFTLTFNGQTTAPLAYNATAAQIDTALEALSNVGANNIQTSGGPVNTANVNVFFRRTLQQSDQPQITATGTALTGTGADGRPRPRRRWAAGTSARPATTAARR